jgi:hypothetical protein
MRIITGCTCSCVEYEGSGELLIILILIPEFPSYNLATIPVVMGNLTFLFFSKEQRLAYVDTDTQFTGNKTLLILQWINILCNTVGNKISE